MNPHPSRVPLIPIVAAAALVGAIVWWTSRSGHVGPEPAREVVSGRAERVILVSLDTVRADHLSLYGYPRPTTPNLEKLATRAAVFTDAMSHAPYTLPSHMSMMTGLYPRAHDVRFATDVLASAHVSVAESLRAAGFRTGAFTDDGFVNSAFGFSQGFEFYDDIPNEGAALNNGFRRYGGRLHDWIRRHRDERFFLFVHSFDCHGPYQVEPRYREALAGTRAVVPKNAATPAEWEYAKAVRAHRYLELPKHASLEEVIDLYDATIRFVDEQIGKLVALLDELGLFEDTLLIITSDHGESFLDHDVYLGHGLLLYEEEVHVPLIVKFPRGRFAGQRTSDVVRHIDLFPTIAASAGADCPKEVQGQDLVPALLGQDREPRIAVGWSPNLWNQDLKGAAASTHYVRRGKIKLLEAPRIDLRRLVDEHLMRPEEGEAKYDLVADPLGFASRVLYVDQMFDLSADPEERVNLLPDRREEQMRIVARLEQIDRENDEICAAFEKKGEAPNAVLSDADIDRLVQQGYISAADARGMKARQERDRLEHERRERELLEDATRRLQRFSEGDQSVDFTEDLVRALQTAGKIDEAMAGRLRARHLRREAGLGNK